MVRFANFSTVQFPRVFEIIRSEGNVTDSDMLRTFNMGVGLAVVVDSESVTEVMAHFKRNGCECYEIGRIIDGQRKVRRVAWQHCVICRVAMRIMVRGYPEKNFGVTTPPDMDRGDYFFGSFRPRGSITAWRSDHTLLRVSVE